MKSLVRFIAITAAAATWIPGTSVAQDSRNQGYLVDINGSVVTSSTTGLCWRDGDWTPARAVESCDTIVRPVAVVLSPRPTPPATVVAVAPSVVPAPAAAPQKISFSADALFGFDQSELTPEGRTLLDGLVDQLSGATYDTIMATGHADRLGDSDYNQKLSLRRADAVRSYLVNRNIPANRIAVDAKGESEPMTKSGECLGARSAAVIACLQADRRVDVEMTGTRAVTTTP